MGPILSVLGVIVLVSGLASLATLLGVSQTYVAGVALGVLALVGVVALVSARARLREPA